MDEKTGVIQEIGGLFDLRRMIIWNAPAHACLIQANIMLL